MFDYTISGGLPSGSRGAWSNLPLRSWADGILTPFSYSTLADITGKAWFHYFDKLGFDPMPKARIMRHINGTPFFSLTLSAQRDAEHAAIEPITLRVNGQPFAVSKWEKPGLLAGIKFALKERKVATVLNTLTKEIDATTVKMQEWYSKVCGYRWTQAEILLVMEEIEPLGARPMTAWLAARHNLDLLSNRLLRVLQAKAPFPASIGLIENALGTVDGLLENEMVRQCAAGQAFLDRFGHRSMNEGELRNARWEEEPASIAQIGVINSSAGNPQPLLDAIESNQRKAALDWLQQMRALLVLQSKAQHAVAYILAGTRRWALAAAREAMVDKRVIDSDTIFFYELEEVKRMMTGEWNVSDSKEIQSTAAKRKAEYAQWQQAQPVELMIGESIAQPVQPWHGQRRLLVGSPLG